MAMISHMNVLYLLSLCLWKLAMASTPKTPLSQETKFITVNAGGNATLQCFFEEVSRHFVLWFKQSLGQEPKFISSYYEQSGNAFFQPDFEKEGRFSVDTEDKNHYLKIKNLQESDSATYYCACKHVNKYTFGSGTFVYVRGSGRNSTALAHQPSTESQESQSCTVQTGSCGEEHSVHWFRGSGQSHPGLVYTPGGSSEQCDSNRDTASTQPHMCAYSIKSHNISQTDTKCAVAACVQAIFKNGSKQRNEYEGDFLNLSDSRVSVLIALLVIVIMAIIFLGILLAILQRRNKCLCKVQTDSNIVSPSDMTPDANQEDDIHYAALRSLKGSRSTRQPSIDTSHCLYASVRL